MKKTFFAASAIVAGLAAGAPLLALAAEQPPSSPVKSGAAPSTTTGVLTKTYSVVVSIDGTLALGPEGARSDHVGTPTSGFYEVIFPSAVTACAFIATIGDAAVDLPAAGLVNVTHRAGNANGVFVQTFNPNGLNANHPFHLNIMC